MKKINVFYCITAIWLFASCTALEIEPEIHNPNMNPDKAHQTITIKVADTALGSGTKAIHGTEENETSFSWQAGIDQIGVLKRMTEYGEDNAYWGEDHHRFTNTTDGSLATFVYDYDEDRLGLVWGEELTLAEGDQIVAYYPYATAASSWYDSSKPYLMSSLGALVQHGNNNTEHLFRGDYMFSRVITLAPEHFDSEGNVNLTIEFGHIFSKMRFSVKNSTTEPLDIHSLVYRSTKEDDIMQGTLILDASNGALSSEGLGDYGMVPPINSAVLEVEDVSINPGETAVLWMWMLPLDFTEGNPDGRMADIMVNTNKGVFRVENQNFDTRFAPGQVYRHGLELTTAKLIEDFAYISDHNFARIIFEGDLENQYDPETGDWIGQSHVTLYDMSFQPHELNEEDMYGGEEFALRGGSYIKLSDAAKVERFHISAGQYNALSLDGLQYFTGLKSLEIELGSDMNQNLTMRALKLGTLANLEELIISNYMQIPVLDVSKNTKLKELNIMTPRLEKLVGLEKLTALEGFNISDHKFDKDMVLDFRNCTALKDLNVPDNVKANISGLTLKSLSVSDARNLTSTGLTCENLFNGLGYPFPSGAPAGVKKLELRLNQGDGAPSMFSQFANMTDLEELNIWFNCAGNDYNFTSAQSSLKKLDIYQTDDPATEITKPAGWNYLTGVDTLYINKDVYYFDAFWNFTTSSPLDLSGMTSLDYAEIKVNQLESFTVPSSLKTLELSTKSAVSFTPTNIVYLNLDAQGKSITLGDAPNLKKTVLYAGADNANDNAITIGACPRLDSLTINANEGKLKLNSSVYPLLKYFRISKGKNISSIPSTEVFPNLEELSISSSGYGSVNNGIGTLDASEYSNLNKLYIGGLDDGYAYRNYNNRYYNGNYQSIRSKGSFVISQDQYNAAKAYALANIGRELFSGIIAIKRTGYIDDTPIEYIEYQVNNIYKVVDNNGNEVSIADNDFSDGNTTVIKTSQTN